MFQNKAKIIILSGLWLTCICVVLGLKTAEHHTGIINALGYFREGAADFSRSALELKRVTSLLNSKDATSLKAAKAALQNSRMSYKKIEFFMDYFFESNAMIYNRPAKAEVDEPYMEYQEPSGFQVMEALLFDEDPYAHRAELMEQAELLSSSAPDLTSLLYGFKGNDKELMESLRLELVKVMTLSITGYDAPELKTGIMESYQSVHSIQEMLQPYLQENKGLSSASLSSALLRTVVYLKKNPDFDTFNRIEFLTAYAVPLQEKLNTFIQLLQLQENQKSALNYDAKNIFSPDAIATESFISDTSKTNSLKAALGKKLFLESSLSGDLKRSCASCHHPDQYFSEGLKTSLAFDGKSNVQRNAPGLLYAGFQYAQFWDGRVRTLQQQVKAVIANPLEMNGNHQVIMASLRKNAVYITAFKKAFPDHTAPAEPQVSGNKSSESDTPYDPVSMDNLADALSAYLMGLAPRNSPFDQYMTGDKKAMTTAQLRGFNLFMGKAQCGSCHFAPLFNGLIPPFYKRTEYEILGTPGNNDFDHLEKDTDQGRFDFFPISYYQAAFKTPTVRNAAKTAPYMHNGVFNDLEKVVEFYNQGGGAGLRLTIPEQTLSAKPLHLTNTEVKEIVVFMQSLTDRVE